MKEKTTRRSWMKKAGCLSAGAIGLAVAGPVICDRGKTAPERMSGSIYKNTSRDNVRAADVIKTTTPRLGRKPNVILILADDLGYGDLSCYGGKAIKTNQIDRMASEGVRFTDFYCSSPICSPSRAGILTGRYPLRSGFTFPLQAGHDAPVRKLLRRFSFTLGSLGVFDLKDADNLVEGMPKSEITMAQALKLAGYKTAAIGKWHLGDFGVKPEFHPHNYGFDTFTGFAASNDEWPVTFYREKEIAVKDIGLNQSEYNRILTDEAIKVIDSAGASPFFIYMAHKDPHQPCIPGKEFQGKSDGGPHGDAVLEVDASVGRILAHLKEKGLDDNTIVLFTSDNGPWFDGRTGGLRGRKGESYEGGFSVPLIVRFPGAIPAGTICDTPAMNIDFFPTILGLAGLSLPNDRVIDGRDLWGILSGGDSKPPHEALFYFHYREIEAARSGDWKFIRSINTRGWPVPIDKRNTLLGRASSGYDYKPADSNESVPTMASWPLLYNLRIDRDESYNVRKKYPEKAAEMLKTIERFETEFYANPRGWLDAPP